MKSISILSFAPLLATLVAAAPATSVNVTTTSANTTAAAAVQNAGLSITNPIQNTSAVMGSTFNIQWTQTDPTAHNVQSIALMAGDSAALTTVIANILNNQSISISTTGYNWTVPSNLTARQDYVLGVKGDNTFTTYSAYFSILASNSTESDTSDSGLEGDKKDGDEDKDDEDIEETADEDTEETAVDEELEEGAADDDAEASDATEATDDAEATEEATDDVKETAEDSSESS